MSRIGLLVGALVTVVVIAWLAGAFDSDYTTVELPEWTFDRDLADRITLATPADTVVIARSGDRWRMNVPVESVVDSTRTNQLLDELEELSFASVVSTNPERQVKFGVDSLGSSIVVHAGNDERRLIVGNSGPDYQTVYVRLGGDDRVLSSRGRVSINATAEYWRDRTIMSVPGDAVTGVRVEMSDGSFGVSRLSGRWMLEEAGASAIADSSAVARWIRRFAPLTGSRFATEEAFESASHLAIITFDTAGGSSAGLELRDSGSELLARRPGSRDVLTISAGMQASLLPAATSLSADR
ncbi:MAG: DUF4340 domain-containing protein [Rhodothermales bacterium]|nr:DUF4340 domain-containing protein [Rhodothermales bacterium]